MTLKCNICMYSSLKHVYIPFIKLLFSFCFQVETAAVALLLEGVDTVKHSKMVVHGCDSNITNNTIILQFLIFKNNTLKNKIKGK